MTVEGEAQYLAALATRTAQEVVRTTEAMSHKRLERMMAEIQNVREKVAGYPDSYGIGAHKILRWLDDVENA